MIHARIDELEGRTIEITQTKHEREKRLKNKMNRISETSEVTTKDL